LRELLAPGESVWVFGVNLPTVEGLSYTRTLDCFQMFIPFDVAAPDAGKDIGCLDAGNAHEMVALTDIAFPGFFRPRTYAMGSYYGLRVGAELVAMAGERLMLPGYPEISGVCTHPGHRGRGYAERLIWHLIRRHRDAGEQSWLHVVPDNVKAVKLYLRLGF